MAQLASLRNPTFQVAAAVDWSVRVNLPDAVLLSLTMADSSRVELTLGVIEARCLAERLRAAAKVLEER